MTVFEYLKQVSIEEMAVIVQKIQMNVLDACGITLKEDEKEHCERLLNWLKSDVGDASNE